MDSLFSDAFIIKGATLDKSSSNLVGFILNCKKKFHDRTVLNLLQADGTPLFTFFPWKFFLPKISYQVFLFLWLFVLITFVRQICATLWLKWNLAFKICLLAKYVCTTQVINNWCNYPSNRCNSMSFCSSTIKFLCSVNGLQGHYSVLPSYITCIKQRHVGYTCACASDIRACIRR